MVNQIQKQQERVLYTAQEIAEMLLVTPKSLLNWADLGKIPVALRTGKTVRFNLTHVMEALANETAEAQKVKRERVESHRAHTTGESVITTPGA